MPVLFAPTLCLAAFLLFSAQPMVAKGILPTLGGSPSVWTTCMLFFQAALLGGYAYAHALATRLGIRRQVAAHSALLAVALALLPIGASGAAIRPPAPGADPTRWLLGFLAISCGVPLFAVSATAPLLQRWYAATGRPGSGDPYFLYGASNLGSLLALLGYPFLVEPNLALSRQERLWSWAFGFLAAMTVACGVAAARSPAVAAGEAVGCAPLGARRVLRWVVLAFVPSSLLLGVTTYLSTDIAPVPLLWVIPLALYLLTFILVFARRPPVPHAAMVRAFPLLLMPLALVLGFGLVQPFWIPLHLLTFFAAAMVCHGELARDRPGPRHLTAFYLALAVGGALGGVFNALVAPACFDRIAEYPLALVLAALMVPAAAPGRKGGAGWTRDLPLPALLFALTAAEARGVLGSSGSTLGGLGIVLASGLAALLCRTYRTRPVRFALGVGGALLASGLTSGLNGRVLHQERDFFGVLQVTLGPGGDRHRLFHGRTLHGEQSLSPGLRREPLAYFHRTGPIGQVIEECRTRHASLRVAVVGLGAGSLAAYAGPGERWTFYEIDPAVVRIARDPRLFTFLRDARAESTAVVVGDGRLRLREAPPGSFDLIVLDAFSADAAPVHLLTREALRIDFARLSRGGLVALNLSNRYLDLDPVVGALADDAGLACRVRYDLTLTPEEERAGKQRSIWAVLAADEASLGALASDPRWRRPKWSVGPAWRDDFSDLARHLVLRRR